MPVWAVRRVQTKIGHLPRPLISQRFIRKRNIRITGTSEEIILARDCENGTELIAVGLGTVSLAILHG